jgi:hypothetical protein
MNQKTYSKIACAAPFLVTPLAIECRDYLDQPYRLAIDIIEVVCERKCCKPLEIAQHLMDTNSNYREKGLNPSTVRQVLQALRKGSVALSSHPKQGWYFRKE